MRLRPNCFGLGGLDRGVIIQSKIQRENKGKEQSKKMSRGGKRPGAGAPQGNVSGMKHGRYSKRMRELVKDHPGGIMVFNKKENRMVLLYSKTELAELKRKGMIE